MPLVLEYLDKYRLWYDLIQGDRLRVFIATEERFPVGAAVPVTLSLPGLPLQLAIEGVVVEERLGSGGQPSGVYLSFGEEQMGQCRRFLGLSQSPGRPEQQGRKSPRVPCELGVELLEPRLEAAGVARNLSERGMLVAAPWALRVGQVVQARLLLEGGQVVTLRGEVSWARHDRQLLGLRFSELPGEGERLVREELTRLFARAPRGSSRAQILVADDQPNILEFLTRALGRQGYAVRKAARGEEALDLVRELHPELVILDILMPGLDGVDICKTMRADVEMADIPVVFLSALEPERLRQVANDAGASDYLQKPVNLTDLVETVERYLRR